ncbi:hypothetical protein [Elongatibacter sediminis]|uniref:Uncharacterized protein n=1 Tax=Elongatibacter sediminis TaxID=3119006 RepID=A0AAW9RBQ1_9GAMM
MKEARSSAETVQRNASDLKFTRERAKRGRVPVHNPEWTDARESDPAMKESGEKGGTTDINIGVGELSGDESEPSATLRTSTATDDD